MESAGASTPPRNARKATPNPDQTLKRDRYRCQRCGRSGSRYNPLQANHLSYAVYNATGRTPIDDLEALCWRCHETGRRFKNRLQALI